MSRAWTFPSAGPLPPWPLPAPSPGATSSRSVHRCLTPGESADCWEIYGRGSSTLIRPPVVESHTAHGFCSFFCCRGRLSRGVGVQGMNPDRDPAQPCWGIREMYSRSQRPPTQNPHPRPNSPRTPVTNPPFLDYVTTKRKIRRPRPLAGMDFVHKPSNTGLISVDRNNKATLPLTIPSCSLSRMQRI